MTSTFMKSPDLENLKANEFGPHLVSDVLGEERNGRILVVDDEESIRALLLEVLSMMDYDAVAFANSGEALIHFQTGSYDLVLTDLDMPGMDGLTLAQYIKDTSPETPVVLVTGQKPETFNERPGRDCIDLIISKPFRMDALQKNVQGILNNKPSQ